MQYHVENQLELFEFHDSDLSLISFGGGELIVSVKHLNIHKGTKQNPSNYDMEIEHAIITFRGFRAANYESGRKWAIGVDGKSYPKGTQMVYFGQEAEEKITEELRNQIAVYYFEKKDDTHWYIDGCGIEPYFTITFSFDSVLVEWDAYSKKAWYELHRQFQDDLTLATPHGEEQVKVRIICHEEDTRFEESPASGMDVNVGIKYEGKDLWGRGKDCLWIDAFADLQKQLPRGVTLRCCLTCRHGNMCPVGNKPGELFCTKNVVITKKSDLYFYTEDGGERLKRSKRYCNVCNDYQPQNEEYYTYNDFYYTLSETTCTKNNGIR